MPRAPVARTGILLTCGKYLHGSIISRREEVWAHKNSITTPFLLKCMYQARKVGGHVYLYVKVCNVMHHDRILSMRVVILCVLSGVLFYVSQLYLSMRVVVLYVSLGFYFMHPDRILSMRFVILCVSPGFHFMHPDRILSMRFVILCVSAGFHFMHPDRILSMRVVIICVSLGLNVIYPECILSMRVVILCVSPGLILFIPMVFCISGHSILYEYQVTLIVFSIYFCLQIKY